MTDVTDLRAAAHEYLAIRRAVGFKLERAEPLLLGFVAFVESEGNGRITSELALRWATLPTDAAIGWWRGRLSVARCFARHMSAIDPGTEVPPTDLLPRVTAGSSRATPYQYSAADVAALSAAARSIRSTLAAATYPTLIGLLAVTGMRVSEALRLDRDDVDWNRGLLRVRDSKFDRSREVALHHTAVDALRAYARIRDERCPQANSPSLFVASSGRRLSYSTVNWHFQRLVRKAGLATGPGRCRPRLHDLRHSFACATLEDWYRAGIDVAARLPLLATYLGHIDPASTYWYLSAKPELLSLAAERLEASLGDLP